MKGSTGNSLAQFFALGPQHWARVVPHIVCAAKKNISILNDGCAPLYCTFEFTFVFHLQST